MPMFEALQQLFAATRVRREPIPFVICRLQPGTPLEPVVRHLGRPQVGFQPVVEHDTLRERVTCARSPVGGV